MEGNFKLKNIGIFLLFGFANLIFWSKPFYGLDFTDGFFHINASRLNIEGMYSSFFLSSLIIKLLSTSFGDDLLNLRMINSSLVFISILLPFLINKKTLDYKVFLYISFGLLILTPLNANILGYDTLSVFFITLIFSFCYSFFQNQKFYFIFILSFLCALTIFIRFPNFILLPILFFFLFFGEKRTYAFCFLIFSLILLVCGYLGVYNTYENFLANFYGSSSHGLIKMLNALVRDGMLLAIYLSILVIILFSFNRLTKLNFSVRVIAVIVLISVFISNFILFSNYSRKYSIFILAITICGLFLFLRSSRKIEVFKENKSVFLFLCLLFVIPFGSNTGLLKASFLFVLFPFLIRYSELKTKTILNLFLIILLPFSLLENVSSTYEDGRIYTLKTIIPIDKLKQIRTSKKRGDYLNDVHSEVIKLRKKKFQVIFYGDKSHIFNYLFPEHQLNFDFYQELNDNMFVNKLEDKMNKGKLAVFLVNNYPGVGIGDQNWLIGEEKLKRIGFCKVSKNSFSYYILKSSE